MEESRTVESKEKRKFCQLSLRQRDQLQSEYQATSMQDMH